MFEAIPSTLEAFYNMVLMESVAALKLNTFTDNFDAERFNIDGQDRSMVFDTGLRASYFDWFFRNHAALFDAFMLLGDRHSKSMFLHIVAFRLAGHHSVRIPVGYLSRTDEAREYAAAEKSVESTLETGGCFGKLRRFDFTYRGQRYLADCVSLEHYLLRKQYFYEQGGVAVRPEPGDAVIDGGACTGDTALVFSNAVGPEGHVYSFDPVWEHLRILEHNAAQYPHRNVSVMPYGISDRNVFCEPLRVNSYSPGFKIDSQEVPLRSLDYLAETGDVQRMDFIKLDVEGAELEALRGAQASIRRFRPKLAVSLYHKPNDLFTIPFFVREHFPFYTLYLDHYTIHNEETVLYCLP